MGSTPGVGDGQGSLVCPWGHKESDTTEQLNWTELHLSVYSGFQLSLVPIFLTAWGFEGSSKHNTQKICQKALSVQRHQAQAYADALFSQLL